MTLVHPVKPFKNPALVLVGDADAGISHRYGRSPRTPRHRNGDTAAGTIILDSIVAEVIDHLAEHLIHTADLQALAR